MIEKTGGIFVSFVIVILGIVVFVVVGVIILVMVSKMLFPNFVASVV